MIKTTIKKGMKRQKEMLQVKLVVMKVRKINRTERKLERLRIKQRLLCFFKNIDVHVTSFCLFREK